MRLLIGKVNVKATEVIACTFVNTSVVVNRTFFISDVRNPLLGEAFVTQLISRVAPGLDVLTTNERNATAVNRVLL